jgi:hypothetical protein
MHILTHFPHPIREIENVFIPLQDGVRLAARIWLPVEAERSPVPAILEYLPYRKDDGTAIRDANRMPYFAGHGYAAVRVDMRGSGDADGILCDEYLPQEQDDALEVIDWLTQQPWCSGAVGIIGISWGGFNGLQIAARRPPALKAIISLCSTDDRYADDVHYLGGCLLASEMLPWASTMLAFNARPPDPRLVGERWRAMWLERLEKSPPYVEEWMKHQRRDAFWKHGSVCEDFAAIECAVYAVGGWADAYTNAVPRLLAGLSCPRKGLIGPWAHKYPHHATPRPAIGFLQECLRWWDQWLKGVETGIMREPMLRVWMQACVTPGAYHTERPGRWVAEPAWPSSNIRAETFRLQASELTTDDGRPTTEAAVSHPSSVVHRPSSILGVQTHGLTTGVWCPYGQPGDSATDQRIEDGRSLSFTSAPLAQPMEILGFPEVTLEVASDQPNALVAVRLCDVAPDGASLLVSWGLLNLTHREGHEALSPLEPGRRYTVTVQLNVSGHTLPAGHCWRVAISPTHWPHAWPSPEPVTLTVFGGRLALPVRAPRADDAALTPFGEPEGAAPLALDWLRTGEHHYTIEHDVVTGRATLTRRDEAGRFRIRANGLEYESASADIFSIIEGQPLSARVRCERVIAIGRGDWQTRVETESVMTSDATHFHLTNLLQAYEGAVRIFAKTWHAAVPRDHV